MLVLCAGALARARARAQGSYSQGCRGHWLARAPRAQGCRARALTRARARAQGGTCVGGTRASARARAHPPTSCHQQVGLTVWFKFKRQSFFCVHGVELLGTHGVELLLHLAEHGLMKLVPIYMFSMGAGTKT